MNEKKKMRGLPKRILSFVLPLMMLLTLMPVISLEVNAASPCETCNGTGKYLADCWRCNGTNLITCTGCGGTGQGAIQGWICGICNGRKQQECDLYDCIDGKIECTCIDCDGSGFLHEHNWQYAAIDNKLETYCADDGCVNYAASYEDAEANNKLVVLTLTATSQNPYGSAATITIGTEAERKAWTDAGLTLPSTVSYEKADGTPLAEAPTETGSYVAKVSPDGVPASTANTATVNFEIQPKPTNRYILTFPAETTVETYGYTELNGKLNVSSGDLESNKCVVVKAEKSEFECAANNGSIDYTLKYGDNKQEFDLSNGMTWTASDAKGNGKPVTIGIDIDEQKYLAAPDGEYEGSIKWTAKLQRAN